MKTRLISASLLALVLALSLAAPAFADDGHGSPDPMARAGGGVDVLPTILWSLAGVGVFAVALGVLYLLKRQVGGFPENPEWVAPISIMCSRDLPADDDSHGHGDPHGGHAAPAH